MAAKPPQQDATDAIPRVDTWQDVVNRYLVERETLWPLAPPILLDDRELRSASPAATVALRQTDPYWFCHLESGELVYTRKSELEQVAYPGLKLTVFEDVVRGELRIYAEPPDGSAPAAEVWAAVAPAFDAFYVAPLTAEDLAREYAKRRIVWHATLYSEKALAELAASLPFSPPVLLLSLGDVPRAPGSDSNIVFAAIGRATNGCEMAIDYPTGFTNGLDVFRATDLLSGGDWELATNGVPTVGTNRVEWTDTSTPDPVGFYAAADALADTDGDGLTDGREKFLYGTDPDEVDTDGDGLVDGYSGVVSTNDYPGGVATNGGAFVEGELSHGTSALAADSDDDGVGDGQEVADGTDPTDGDWPPSVAGSISYSGWQTGTVVVVAVGTAESWSTNDACRLDGPDAYRIPALTGTNCYVKAFLDTDADGEPDSTEAWGALPASPIAVTNKLTGQDFALGDPDDDEDGLPDWWEVLYWTNTTAQASTNDPDGDLYSNGDEYLAHTDPTDDGSHPFNVEGTIGYDGWQPGTFHVIATLSPESWEAAGETTLSSTGTYALAHLPVGETYWVKAWLDGDESGTREFGEAWGVNTNGIVLTAACTNADVVLVDGDYDEDGLPDWWELAYGMNATNAGAPTAVARWEMDGSGSETNVLDSGPLGLTGSVVSAASAGWVDGISSNALRLDGTNTCVQLPDDEALQPEYVTVSLWVRPSVTYSNQTAVLFSKRPPGGSTGYELVYTNGTLRFTICSSGAKTVSYACVLTNGVWTHVAGSYSGETQTLYLAGQAVASTNYNWGTGFGYLDNSSDAPRLGASLGASPTAHFAGDFERVMVFDAGLNVVQVAALAEWGGDEDADGIPAAGEFYWRTNPNSSDTDGDGTSDGDEVQQGTDPNNDDTSPPTVVIDWPTNAAKRVWMP